MSVGFVVVLPLILGACQLIDLGAWLTPSAEPERPSVTCADWKQMTDQERVALADRIVGGSADLLERIRVRQHQPVGTSRDLLLADVSNSLTKLCDVWAPPDRPVIEVFDALY
jgi:hypothetical protein